LIERILQPTPIWNDCHPADLILVFLRLLIAGVPRVSKTKILQYTLFKRGKYSYSAFVTNLDLQPRMVWKTCHARANVEKSIRELPNCFSLNKIPTHDWVANVAFLQLLLFACDIVHWFKRLCLPGDRLRATVNTIRQESLVLPGKLTRHGSRNVLQLPKDYPHHRIFLEAARKIQTLRFPEPEPGEKFGFASNRK
jgi:hypothetical protein